MRSLLLALNFFTPMHKRQSQSSSKLVFVNGPAILNAIEQSHLSVSEVADRAELSTAVLYTYLKSLNTNPRKAQSAKLELLADTLRCDVSELIFTDDSFPFWRSSLHCSLWLWSVICRENDELPSQLTSLFQGSFRLLKPSGTNAIAEPLDADAGEPWQFVQIPYFPRAYSLITSHAMWRQAALAITKVKAKSDGRCQVHATVSVAPLVESARPHRTLEFELVMNSLVAS